MNHEDHEEHERDYTMEFDALSNQVIGGALEIHRSLGPGLLESAYEACLAYELEKAGLAFRRQHPIPVTYKTVRLDCGYRADFVIERQLIIELKSIEKLLPIHEAQLLSYMKLAEVSVGLLINFNVKLLKDGIKRMVL